MSTWLLAVVGFIYAIVAVMQAWEGKWPMAVVLGGYALSNFGLLKMTL